MLTNDELTEIKRHTEAVNYDSENWATRTVCGYVSELLAELERVKAQHVREMYELNLTLALTQTTISLGQDLP